MSCDVAEGSKDLEDMMVSELEQAREDKLSELVHALENEGGLNGSRYRRKDSRSDGPVQVLVAAADAFTVGGYTGTSIDDIAERLGVTKGYVYHYYRSKADLFIDVHRTALALMLQTVEPIAHGERSPDQRLFDMARAHVSLILRYNAFMRVSVQAVEMALRQARGVSSGATDPVWEMRDRYEALYREVIADGIDAEVFRVVPAARATKPVLGALNWIVLWYRADESVKTEELGSEFATFVVAGLRRYT